MDRSPAAGGDRAARSAFARRHRHHDSTGLSRTGARAPRRYHSSDLPSASAGRDFYRAYRLSGHADAAHRSCAAGLDGARDQRRTGRRQEAGDGDESRRQQRGHEPCRAGFAREIRASCRQHRVGPLRRAGGIVFCGRIAPWHSRRRRRDVDHAGAIPCSRSATKRSRIFVPRASRWRRIIAGWPRSGQRRSRGRPRIFTQAAPPAMPRRPPRKKAIICSITAPAHSANCWLMSINSIRPCFRPARRAEACWLTICNRCRRAGHLGSGNLLDPQLGGAAIDIV